MADHWVPKCYLKNFETREKRGRVYLYQHSESPKPAHIDNVAAENNLYTFKTKDGKDSRGIEDAFGVLETATSPILEKIIQEKALHLADKEYGILAEFISYLVTRGPSFRESQQNIFSEGYKLNLKASAQDAGILQKRFAKAGVTFESKKELQDTQAAILDEHFSLSVTGKGHFFKKAMEISKGIRGYLLAKSWHLLISKTDRVFVTSDNPVVIQKMKGVPWHLSSGFIYGTIILSLSPNLCLIMRSLPMKDSAMKVSRSDVDYINRSIMKSAHRQVYANISSRDIKEIRDEFPPGQETMIKPVHIKNTPYTMMQGLEKDFELPYFSKVELPVDRS